MSQPASCCMTNSSSSTVGGYFFFKSLVPLEHRGFRALILLLLLSFVSCCRWGPSFLPCCSLVLLPTTPFLTGAFYFFSMFGPGCFSFFPPTFLCNCGLKSRQTLCLLFVTQEQTITHWFCVPWGLRVTETDE